MPHKKKLFLLFSSLLFKGDGKPHGTLLAEGMMINYNFVRPHFALEEMTR